MAKGEVHQAGSYGSNSNAGTRGSGGGRNRLTGGVSNTGSNSRAGASGAHSKSNGDAMSGSYSADKITSVGGIQMQDALRKAGAGAKSSGGPFEPTMMTERDKLPSAKADPKTVGSMKNSPKGEFGGAPGQSGSGRSTQGSGYKSQN